MYACRDRIDEELEVEQGKAASLKDQILKWERMLVGQRRVGGTTRRSIKCDKRNLSKSTCTIEDKLHRGHKCFNKLMTRNGELREELNILQVEKKQFLHIKSLLEKELHAICKDIYNPRNKCTDAYGSVKIQEKQRMLRSQNAKDVAQYIKERRNLEQEISHYCYFAAFLDIKTFARSNQDIDRRKVEKCKQLDSKELELEDFEDAIKQILRETERNDLDKLIRNFQQMEEQNFTILNFVNYEHNKAEAIRRQISQLCSEREIFVAEEQQQQEKHQALCIRVSIKQEPTEQQLVVYQQRVKFMEKLVDQLKAGVKSLLRISYDSSLTCDEMDSCLRFDTEKIKEYLRMAEDRVNELLTLQFQEKLSQEDNDSLSTLAGQLLGITPPAVSRTTAAETRAPNDNPDLVESVLLEAKAPVTREELLTLANKRIQREDRLT